jgi:hypothetical protein
MKIIKNEKLIKRNGSIGGWTLGASMLLLGGALYINIFKNPRADIQSVYLMSGGFVVGYILMLIGLYFVNRFGGNPRIDEKIDSALKGLPGDYTIYHFKTPAPHLLVGPAGIWVLIPYRQRGIMTYTKNRWRVKNGGFAQTYMSIFGLEGIGRPDLEAENEINSVKKHLVKNLSENDTPEVRATLLFTNEQMEIQVEGAPLPAMKLKQLKDFMRQKAKEKPLRQIQLTAIKSALPE